MSGQEQDHMASRDLGQAFSVFRVPIRVSVAPVQTYAKTIEVRASSPEEAARIIQGFDKAQPDVLSDAIDARGWKSVGGRLGPITPNRTVYDTYLDEDGLAAWVASFAPRDAAVADLGPGIPNENTEDQDQ